MHSYAAVDAGDGTSRFIDKKSETTIGRFETGALAEQPVIAAFLAHLTHPRRLSLQEPGRDGASDVTRNMANRHTVSFSGTAEGQGERQSKRACKRCDPTCHYRPPSRDEFIRWTRCQEHHGPLCESFAEPLRRIIPKLIRN